MVYLKLRLFAYSIASLCYEICELLFVLPILEHWLLNVSTLRTSRTYVGRVFVLQCIYVLAFLPYNRFILPCQCSTVDTSYESAT